MIGILQIILVIVFTYLVNKGFKLMIESITGKDYEEE